MQQIKLFVGREDHTSELEAEVNNWIVESGANILSISGNIAPQSVLPSKDVGSNLSTTGTHTRRFAPSDILVIVTYEKG
ncbi:MAG: hypothetical protein ACPG4Q_13475 [Phycisphaeraceae bacterium]|jgi:hypothetical protein